MGEVSLSYYTMSQENVPLVTCYNLDVHSSIMIIFGTSVTEKVANQNVLYFPTSSNLCFCTTWRNRKPKKCIFSLKSCMLFAKNTWNTLKYHLVTAEPPFTVKMIKWVHQTGPRILLSVTHMLNVSRCQSLCKRWVLFFIKPRWKSMDSINGISYYLNKC